MDSLDTLPTSDDEDTTSPQQTTVMNKYFGSSNDKPTKSPWKNSSKWKIVGMAAVAFLFLANPWIQAMLEKAPYFGGNTMTTLLLTLLIFVILMIIIVMFMG